MSRHIPDYVRAGMAAMDKAKVTGPYLLTWSKGTMVQPFRDESSALHYAWILATVYGTTDAQLTGPDHDYIACEDECGRLMRDGDGLRIGKAVYHPFCYAKHPVVVGATMAEMFADERQDNFNRSRR